MEMKNGFGDLQSFDDFGDENAMTSGQREFLNG